MRCGLIVLTALGWLNQASAAEFAWSDPGLTPAQRTEAVMVQMTQEEKLRLVRGYFGADLDFQHSQKHPQARAFSAGVVEGIPRLGIPALFETDAGIGVATQGSGKNQPRERTALPSGLATAATWNRELAYQGGAMIGAEARASGFNVMLGGAANLIREPRNGRNFEYAGEDPLLAGVMVAQQIRGIESNHLIATMKHFALNAQETGRMALDAQIDEAGLRMSDLLAMQFVIEQANPGAVMCAYNQVNGSYACENAFLLNQVLKSDWQFQGFVMSDWGATHSAVQAANSGLDQESGSEFDTQPFFGTALATAVEQGEVAQSRLDDMVRRIVRTIFAKGLFDYPVQENQTIDVAGHELVSRTDAEEAIVLLKNRNHLLPLKTGMHKILVIGAHADVGVLSGGGSSQVYPPGGMAVTGLEPASWPGPVVYFPSAPLAAIKSLASLAEVSYYDGDDPAVAAKLAAASEAVILFAQQWSTESRDAPDLHLPDHQDELISAVGEANRNTVLVLETGGAVLMPWVNQVGAILQAWYPGTRGGEAIARVLFGVVNPSGHLPVSIVQSEAQLVRPVLDGDPADSHRGVRVDYSEGAAVGYKWLTLHNSTPLFAFGFGLSYTEFRYANLAVHCAAVQCQVSFTVTNTGHRSGKAVPQVYVSAADHHWEAPLRLAGWDKIALAGGQSRRVALRIDPRLLATFDSHDKSWQVRAGQVQFRLSRFAGDNQALTDTVFLPATVLPLQNQQQRQ